MRLSLLAFTIIILFNQCDDKLKFIDKEVLIARSNPLTKTTIKVPESCGKFNQGVKISLDAKIRCNACVFSPLCIKGDSLGIH